MSTGKDRMAANAFIVLLAAPVFFFIWYAQRPSKPKPAPVASNLTP